MMNGIYRNAFANSLHIGALTIMLYASANAQKAGDLEACAALQDPEARLACYDAVSQRQREAESSDGVNAELPRPAASGESGEPAMLSDDVGEEQLSARDEKEGPVRGTLTDCREGPAGKWYFYFDNGQVWEQRDSDQIDFKQCDFEVTISKDFFGYKMAFADTDNKIRVARVR